MHQIEVRPRPLCKFRIFSASVMKCTGCIYGDEQQGSDCSRFKLMMNANRGGHTSQKVRVLGSSHFLQQKNMKSNEEVMDITALSNFID